MSNPRNDAAVLATYTSMDEFMADHTARIGRVIEQDYKPGIGMSPTSVYIKPDMRYKSITDYETIHQYYDAYPERIGKDYKECK